MKKNTRNERRAKALSRKGEMESALLLCHEAFTAIDAKAFVFARTEEGLTATKVIGDKDTLTMTLGATMKGNPMVRDIVMEAFRFYLKLQNDPDDTFIETIEVKNG